MEKTLHGYRILITRAEHQASQLADALTAAGAEAISVPTIEITPPADDASLLVALKNIRNYDWLVFSSANAIDAVISCLAAAQITAEDFAHLQIAAIGPATARAAEAAGLVVSLVPLQAIAESLADALTPLVAGKKVLLPQAAAARDVLAQSLSHSGAIVTAVEAYRSIIPAVAIEKLREAFSSPEAAPHAVAFTSSSTAQHFFALLAAAHVTLPPATVLASIGPITSETLRTLGHAPQIEATEHTIPGLVEAIKNKLSR
jgi:uroporphyrinogen-III synthase